MHDGAYEDAVRLEALLPQIMRVLFHHDEDDPLGHLSMAQLRIMRLLYVHPVMTSEVSEDLGMTPSAVSQTASRLEKMGLIERQPDARDRRIRRLGLTEDGIRRMRERQTLRVTRALAVLNSIPASHRRRLIAALDELLKACGPCPDSPESLAMVAELEQTLPNLPPLSDPAS